MLEEVKESDRPILESLLQTYLLEFSEFSHEKKDDSGEIPYPYLNFYWQDPNRHPFFLKEGKEIVGFALVRKEIDPIAGEMMELAEFFILDAYREKGRGQQAAGLLWDLFSSKWTLSVMDENQRARIFWPKVISKYTQNQYELTVDKNKSIVTYTFYSSAYPAPKPSIF